MYGTNASEKSVSDAQFPTTHERHERDGRGREPAVVHEPVARVACPECEGRVVTEDETSFCQRCGLVVAADWVDRSPTLSDLGLVGNGDGDSRKSIETLDPLQSDRGLHTTFDVDTDGRGNPLGDAQQRKYRRLQKRHQRYRFGSRRKRRKRLNEALRDAEMLGANLDLPAHVPKTAASYIRTAADAELPAARMPWEAIAGGAVLYATRVHGPERKDIDRAVAQHAKASHERVCAAARAVRFAADGDQAARPNAVQAVLGTVDDTALPPDEAVELWRLARHLLQLGDDAQVGDRTPRLTVAAAAVYAADRLTPGKHWTQQGVADAASAVVETSYHRIKRYNGELVDAYEARHGTTDPDPGLRAVTAPV